MDDVYTCPKCGGETVKADCQFCHGTGLQRPDFEKDCPICDGGTLEGVFECSECGEIYEAV